MLEIKQKIYDNNPKLRCNPQYWTYSWDNDSDLHDRLRDPITKPFIIKYQCTIKHIICWITTDTSALANDNINVQYSNRNGQHVFQLKETEKSLYKTIVTAITNVNSINIHSFLIDYNPNIYHSKLQRLLLSKRKH